MDYGIIPNMDYGEEKASVDYLDAAPAASGSERRIAAERDVGYKWEKLKLSQYARRLFMPSQI